MHSLNIIAMTIHIKNHSKAVILILSALFFYAPSSFANGPPTAGIATAHPLATDAGNEILDMGGNAFDAAIAITSTIAVVEPTGSGLGGGGFWLIHRAKDKFETMIDGREKAPLAAHRDLYLDKKGNVIEDLSITGPLAAGIPGTPAAIVHLAKKYGVLPLNKSLAPAIRHAKNGFAVDKSYVRMASFRLQDFGQSADASDIFLDNDNVPAIGYIIKQPDLAKVLEAIAKDGRDGFYSGSIAKKLVDGTREAGGIWTLNDLKQYQIIEREPVRGNYLGMRITSAAPPSSGGIAMVSIFNMLSNFDMVRTSTSTQKHFIIEAMRRAYRDRAEFLGDPDFYNVPVTRLIDKKYADQLASSIQPDKATPSSSLRKASAKQGGNDTTHFSVIDTQGNRVSATLSINYPFGSTFVPPGTGVLLNDEMDDFSSKPGVPNAYGLVGGEANAIAPGKRPLSSMTPTFLETKDRIAVVGTPGGSRIITMVMLASLKFHGGATPAEMVSLKRFHHQYLPDRVQYEPGVFSNNEMSAIKAMGHTLKEISGGYGNMQAVVWDKAKNTLSAASDPRVIGKSTP